jgi:hypothetical protein
MFYQCAYEAIILSEERYTLETTVNKLKSWPTENTLVINKNNMDIRLLKGGNVPISDKFVCGFHPWK